MVEIFIFYTFAGNNLRGGVSLLINLGIPQSKNLKVFKKHNKYLMHSSC